VYVFSQQIGSVVRYNGNNLAQPFKLEFDPILDSVKGIATAFLLNEAGNFTITPTFDDMLYIYRFGAKPGQLRISGLWFRGNCDAGDSEKSGFDDLLAYYRKHNVASKQATLTIKISISEQVFRAVLVDIQLGLERPELGIGQWIMQFNTIPAKF